MSTVQNKQKVLRPGQLLTYNKHVYQVKKGRFGLCFGCALYNNFKCCEFVYTCTAKLPLNCILKLVK